MAFELYASTTFDAQLDGKRVLLLRNSKIRLAIAIDVFTMGFTAVAFFATIPFLEELIFWYGCTAMPFFIIY